MKRRESRRPVGAMVGLALGGAVALAGCAEAAAESPLAGAYASKEALVERAVEALERHDTTAMRALRITREEYETLLWPEMPDSEQMPFEFVWSVTEPRSRKALREVMGKLGGVPHEVLSIEFDGEPEVYESFRLHRDAVVTARRGDTGEVGRLTFFDVFGEYRGTWKLMDFDEL